VGFVTARLMRIFPALIATALVLALVLGPILAGRNPVDYASSRDTISYVLRTVLLLDGTAALPGAFDHQPAPETTITVWTLKYELACYLGLLGLGMLGLACRRWVAATLAVSGLGLALLLSLRPDIAALHTGIHHTVRFAACFWLGMAAWRFRDVLPVDWRIAGALGIVALACMRTPLSDALIYLAEVYGALVIALMQLPLAASRFEVDLSYGLYLYGYPVEQTLMRYLPDVSAPLLATVALLVTAVIAFASWRYVEHPAIRIRSEVAALLARALQRARRTAL
jgi:peptidoglycan/LPS O-acetylase OafA/YrhL